MQFVLLSIFLLLAAPLSARQFYVLLTADTITEVKKASKKDLHNMKKEIELAADCVGAKFDVTELYGKDLTAQALHGWLTQKPITSEDVVFFYYTGHGLRTEKSPSIWPFLYFPARRELVDTNQLVNIMKSRGAGLSIILADCCNNFISEAVVQNSMKPKSLPFFIAKRVDKNGYKRLFKNARGLIVASGSVPGKRSWATPKGGIFTNAFLTSLRHELEENHPVWERVLSKTKSLCSSFQKPQYQMQVSYEQK